MTIEVTAKKVDEAIKQGLAQLGATIDDVTVEVLEQGGLFRKAKVRLTLDSDVQEEPATEKKQEPRPAAEKKTVAPEGAEKAAEKPAGKPAPQNNKATEKPAPTADGARASQAQKDKDRPENKKARPAPEKRRESARAENAAEARPPRPADPEVISQATAFVAELVAKMGFETAKVSSAENGNINIEAEQGDDSLLIGRHGETLGAMAFLAETLCRAEKRHANITVDCNGYRARREASLTSMARRRADECVDKRRKIKLEPMERIDRRTIHNALTSDSRVTTSSEGKEPYRYVVILPKKQ